MTWGRFWTLNGAELNPLACGACTACIEKRTSEKMAKNLILFTKESCF